MRGLAIGKRPRLDILGLGVVLDSQDSTAIGRVLRAWSRCLTDGPSQEDDLVLTADQVDTYADDYQPEALAMRLTAEGILSGAGR